MKLIRKTNRHFLFSLLIILVVSCVLIFLGTTYLFRLEAEEKLQSDEARLFTLLNKGVSIQSIEPFFVVTKCEKEKLSPQISNVLLFDPLENEEEEYMELTSVRSVNGQNYEIKVRHSVVDTNELAFFLLLTFILIMLVSLSALYLLNNSFSVRIWAPFYKTLRKVEAFSIEKGTPIQPSESDIDEFVELDNALFKLSDKLIQDYITLKEFTENASHEIQTPLAILMLNLEEALQSELDENTAKRIYTSYQAAERLSRLNEKLLLLTKLDNGQFQYGTRIDLNDLIKSQCQEYEPLFKEKSIHLTMDIDGEFNIDLDQGLATILVNNILFNAIKHGIANGTISIKANRETISISNQTDQSPNTAEIFDRFKKGSLHRDSLGLGLAITKKIADLSGLDIHAKLNGNEFILTLQK